MTPDDLPAVCLHAELPLSRFGVRATRVLQHLSVRHIGDFLNVDWDVVECWQLDATTRNEIQEHRAAMGRTPESVSAWLDLETVNDAHSLTSTMSPLGIPAPWRDLPIQESKLSVRARHVLQSLGIATFGAFLQADFRVAQAYQLGTTTRAELIEEQKEQRARLTRVLAEGSGQAEEMQAHFFDAQQDESSTLPTDLEVRRVASGALDLPLLWPHVVRSIIAVNERAYQVLAHRFALDGCEQRTLHEIGVMMKVSRERVRQIEEVSLKKLRRFLREGKTHDFAPHAHPALLSEVHELQILLSNIDFPLSDGQLWGALAEHYQKEISPAQRAFLILLFDLLELKRLHYVPPKVLRPLPIIWLDDAQSQPLVLIAAKVILRALLAQAEPQTVSELLSKVNSFPAVPAKRVDDAFLRRFLALCPCLEQVEKDAYQMRFEELLSHVPRVERIMQEWALQGKTTATVHELQREVIRRYALAGIENKASYGTIARACTASSSVVNIGKSGDWTLRKYAGEIRDIHQILEEALLSLNRPATLDELASYVLSRRTVASTSIAGTLGQHHKFQCIKRRLYGLRCWGLPEAPPLKCGPAYQRQFEDALRQIFRENDAQPLPLAQLVHRLRQALGWQEVSIRTRLVRSPYLDLTPLSSNRLLAHWRKQPKEESPPKIRQTKRERIQNMARLLLSAAPDKSMTGIALVADIAKRTDCQKTFIYNMLASMADVQRLGGSRNVTYQLLDES